ncbi:hypothetical protein ABTY61_22950 [Kitasatospora sp. NPDC096128]|uniref:hypothetical protein n=1 Tax=Kitasatospora sp. NPDC096128 TaxID=3155547 RepID=UPI003318769B
MGNVWRLFLGDHEILEGRWDAPAKLMTVFQEEDKYMHRPWARMIDRAKAGLPDFDFDDPETFRTYPDIDPEAYRYQRADDAERFGYRTTVGTAVTRLKLMGFTAERCRQMMTLSYREQMLQGDVIEAPDGKAGPGGEPEFYVVHGDDVTDIGLQAYLKRAADWSFAGRNLTELEQLCLQKLEHYFGAEPDQRWLLAGLLGGQDPQTVLRLDLGDLLADGAFRSTDNVAAQALQDLRNETASTGPVIVITEGRFDSRVLPQALRLVRPDIAGYFKFLDFDAAKAQGGTDRVVATLKSFAAAGVMNRVIGLVDNDTAGREAIRQLASITLPSHYSACLLPDLDYAHSYPTLGPSGESNDNVNGRACSIEFYFGLTTLQGPDGAPTPVQWKAFKESVQDYQGELTNKQYIQGRIDAFLAAAEGGAPLDESWEPMRLIAQTLIDKAESR